ncbi:MAG: ferritin-like domain-containing protein [Planctomycetota bacterium]
MRHNQSEGDRVEVVASIEWRRHFWERRGRAALIPWDTGRSMIEAERDAVAGSIAEFELGERSEGRNLMRFARQHAAATGDEAYVPAMGLFIAEENRHAAMLARLMKVEGMGLKEKTATDGVFRWLRRLAGLELSIMVLVTAEIIAQVYYRALRDATGSAVLRAICRQILEDEDHHIRFQCERLAILRSRRSRVTVWRRRVCHRVLMGLTIAVVWKNHGKALRAGGYTLGRFRRHVAVKLERAMGIADPRGYLWPAWEAARVA